MEFSLYQGDSLDILKGMPDNSVDSIVTDPPYGLSFMGKKWDYDVPSVEIFEQCLRVLKPGGHLLAFAGTRTQHRMAVNIEDAGFEIRDMIAWVYGTGFPKSMNVGKAIDKAAGAKGGRGPLKRGGERLARLADGKRDGEGRWGDESGRDPYTYVPATSEAQQWDGWGTALKPALEPITVARKPFKGTVANNVLTHGTGAINIDGCRVGTSKRVPGSLSKASQFLGEGSGFNGKEDGTGSGHDPNTGRWPANLIHDGSDEVVELFPAQTGKSQGRGAYASGGNVYGNGKGLIASQPGNTGELIGYGDSGSAARFFYCAKASKKDREDGNNHPTVKPTDLMAYLVRLVTPPGGVVLDPFMGSGSTGKACAREGFDFIGCDLDPEFVEIARKRITGTLEA